MVPALPRDNMDAVVPAIRSANEIVLACHVNPDGDALGSMLGLALGLETLGKKTTCLSADGVPPTLAFLPSSERVQTETERRDFSLAIVVDSGDLSRTGTARETVLAAQTVVDIDHHVTAGAFGHIRLLDATASATAEIVYDVLLALGVALTGDMATCLLCGLLTDTGSFRYNNVTPRTMELGGQMITLGASPNEIATQVFENKPWGAQKLLGCALDRMQKTPNSAIVWTHVTQADFIDFGATDADTEGIVNAIRMVEGIWAALFLRETPNNRFRVSLRARDGLDVSQVAARFGGGGHRLASGCSLDGPIETAASHLVQAVQEQMARDLPHLFAAHRKPIWFSLRTMDGLLSLNKPKGMTSHDVVARVRRVCQTKRAGHAGTLDPDATGVLVVAVGQATRLLPHLPLEPKRYTARLLLGVSTSTEDASGKIEREADASHITQSDLAAVLPKFIGPILQIPPMVSALHHEGRRLYDLAREGITVERAARSVIIHDIVLLDFAPGPNAETEARSAEATLTVTCGGGTYIRTLCKDIGAALGLPAHMKTLVRDGVGPFDLNHSIPLADLTPETAQTNRILMEEALPFPQQNVSDVDAAELKQGRPVPQIVETVENSVDNVENSAGESEAIVALLHDGALLALARSDGRGLLHPFKVFTLPEFVAPAKGSS